MGGSGHMKNNMARTISLLLLIAMLAGLISGCSDGGVKIAAVEDTLTSFYRDRVYALDADNTDPTEAELNKAKEYLETYLLNSIESGKIAFDFSLGETTFSSVLTSWASKLETVSDTEVQTDYVLKYTKTDEPITVTVYATLYKETPIIEWTVWLENEGAERSETITGFSGLRMNVAAPEESDYNLVTFQGSHQSPESFRAEMQVLEADKTIRLAGTGGKPSTTWAPYFNLQWEDDSAKWDKSGIFVSVGWSGQWESLITKTADGVTLDAHQEKLETYLDPGESIRSPLINILFWEQDFMRSQNLFRRWLYTTAMPQQNGAPLATMLSANTAQETSLTELATTENQIEAIERWAQAGLLDGIGYWQMDAGWYDSPADIWENTGSWAPDPERFGDSLMPISEKLTEYGMKLILWYEPERVITGTDFYELKDGEYIIKDRGWHLFNLSDEDALAYLCEYMSGEIQKNGVGIYRQDCNVEAPSLMTFWSKLNTEGRVGYTENRYVIGYLTYFDYLLEHNPGLLIDSCASGGRRMDLETLKRAITLWRDDSCYEPTLTQCQSWGINFFVPFSGQGTIETDPALIKYTFRSNMMQSTIMPYIVDTENTEQIALYKRNIEEFNKYSKYLVLDYYPLTDFSSENNVWMAWQYNDYDGQSGIIQVFKRPESTETEQTYLLSGLELNAKYVVLDVDTGEEVEMTGRQLMVEGFTVTIKDEFDAKLFHYQKK